MKSRWFTNTAPSLAHRPPELELLADKYDPWLKRGQPKKQESSKAEAESSIFNQSQLYENQHVPHTNYLKRNQASRFLNQAQVGASSFPYWNNQDLLFDERRYNPRRRTDDNGMDGRQLVREDAPTQRTAGTFEDDNIDFIMELERKQLVQNCLRTQRQNIPKPQVYDGPVNIQRKQESKEWELMSQKRGHRFKVPRLVPGTLCNPIFVDHDTSLPMSSSVLLRSPSDFSRRSTSPYAASSSRSVETVASSSNSVTHDQQHTLFDNFGAFLTVNDLEQNIRELSDFLGLPDDSRVEATFDNNAGELNDNLDVSEYILNSPINENITVDSSNNSSYETIQNQINIENNKATNQDEFAHNNDNAKNSSSAEFFPSCVGDELASLWGISCDP